MLSRTFEHKVSELNENVPPIGFSSGSANAVPPVQLVAVARRFTDQCRALAATRPLLAYALAGDEAAPISALDAEMRAEQAVDRAYWEPVRRELEAMRLDEARKKRISKDLI